MKYEYDSTPAQYIVFFLYTSAIIGPIGAAVRLLYHIVISLFIIISTIVIWSP